MNKQSSKDSNTTLTKKESTETPTSPGSASESDGEGYGNDSVSRPSNFSSYADYTSRDVSEDIDDEDPPPLSERVATYHDDVSPFYGLEPLNSYLIPFTGKLEESSVQQGKA